MITNVVASNNTGFLFHSAAGLKPRPGLAGLSRGRRQGWFLLGALAEGVSRPFPASPGACLPRLPTLPVSAAGGDAPDLCVRGLVSLSDPPASLFRL